METTTITKTRWFWPWQDEKEEAWLESMSQEGWHLKSVQLPCVYTFGIGQPCHHSYRLDYLPTDKSKWAEYMQIFRDAGWEYIGEMSNWRYWRKLNTTGETPEIFTDAESKIRKYRRMLLYMGFFLMLLVFLGSTFYTNRPWVETGHLTFISSIYLLAMILYAVIIPIYVVVLIKLLLRIRQLKRKNL